MRDFFVVKAVLYCLCSGRCLLLAGVLWRVLTYLCVNYMLAAAGREISEEEGGMRLTPSSTLRAPIHKTTNGAPQNRNNSGLHATITIRQRRQLHMQSSPKRRTSNRTNRKRLRIRDRNGRNKTIQKTQITPFFYTYLLMRHPFG